MERSNMTREALQPDSGNARSRGRKTPQLPAPSGDGSQDLGKQDILPTRIVIGDNGKPLAIPLTSEQAKAGKDALDALMLHPDIHPDTTVNDAIIIFNEQLPIIDEKAKALEEEQARALALRTRRRVRAGLAVTAGFVGWMGFSLYDAMFSPTALRAWEAAQTITATKPTETSIRKWMARVPEDPTVFGPKDPDAKPRILSDRETIIVNNHSTGIGVSDARLHDGRVVTELKVAYDPRETSSVHDFYLPSEPLETVTNKDTQIVIFESPILGEEAAVAITRKPTTPPTFEIRDLKKFPPAR